MFDPRAFRRITLEDAEELIPELTGSKVNSCECVFGNLYTWGHPCGTVFQRWKGHLYFYLECNDVMFFADEPEVEELAEISSAMQKNGCSGRFFQVRAEYVEAHPELSQYFMAEPVSDASAEYIYDVDSLVELSGEKLRKKRNLIKQFLRDNPDAEVVPVTHGTVLDDVLALAEEWRAGMPDPDTASLRMESAALSHLADGFDTMGYEGVAVYVKGHLAACAIYARVNGEMFTESFEKSRAEYKGAAQMVNHEMAKRLSGRCRYINREQDLGSEGLRKAKLSYAPVHLLKNYCLIPK